MALTIDDCLIEQGRGTNEMYANCCCTFSCVVTNPDDTRIIVDDESGFAPSIDYTLSNFLIDGNPVAYPFTIEKGQQFTMEFTVCAATEINVAAYLFIKFYDLNSVAGTFNFDFITIDTNTTVDVTSIDFTNVPLGSSASVPISFDNPTACCYEYFLSSDCADITFETEQTDLLCPKDKGQTINVTYTPTSLDGLDCNVIIEAGMCFKLVIPVTGTAVEPVAGGSSNGQKNKVDQTSVLPACSPRTINNQCNTGATARSAITSRAQTITRPSGGAGRGKGFSK